MINLSHIDSSILIDPTDIDAIENGYCVLIGGFADLQGLLTIAESYKNRADELVDIAIQSRDMAYEYTFPVLYLYRHALELFLKSISQDYKRSHRFDDFIENLKKMAEKKLPEGILAALVTRISEFKEIDERSTRFRYGNQLGEEFLINLKHLKLVFSEMIAVITALRTELH